MNLKRSCTVERNREEVVVESIKFDVEIHQLTMDIMLQKNKRGGERVS
jgi:hypothetical protein